MPMCLMRVVGVGEEVCVSTLWVSQKSVCWLLSLLPTDIGCGCSPYVVFLCCPVQQAATTVDVRFGTKSSHATKWSGIVPRRSVGAAGVAGAVGVVGVVATVSLVDETAVAAAAAVGDEAAAEVVAEGVVVAVVVVVGGGNSLVLSRWCEWHGHTNPAVFPHPNRKSERGRSHLRIEKPQMAQRFLKPYFFRS